MGTSKETRATIIALYQNGLTCKEIAAKNIAPERTIYCIIKNIKETGSSAAKKASGHPRVSSQWQDRLLFRSQLRNGVATSAELAQYLLHAGVAASARTVRQGLLNKGLVSRRAAKKPLLSKKNINTSHNRLKFCRKHREQKTGAELFSQMNPPFDYLVAVRRRKDQRYHESCVVPTVNPSMFGVASHPREWAHSQSCPKTLP